MSSAALHIALCATAHSAAVLCAALPIPGMAAGEVPDWIHLLPAGEVQTVDPRGPYRVADPAALIAASLVEGDRLPLDENHATDLAAPQGGSAPARGWIVEMQSRADGIWGKVEWTAAGRQLVADKAYRHISPAIAHSADKTIVAVLRASLVNRPNLRGLAALHQQDDRMDFMAKLREALGLSKDGDEEAILAAVKGSVSLNAVAKAAGQAEGAAQDVVLQAVSTHAAQLAPIAKAAGLAETASAAAVLQAVQVLADPAKTVPASAVVALQAEVATLRSERAREKAEAFVDGAIKAGKIAAPAQMREHYIARHMADAKAVETEIGAMVSLHGRGLPSVVPPGQAGALDEEEERIVVQLMGLDPGAYAETRKRLGQHEEIL